MENQESNLNENNSSTAVLENADTEVVVTEVESGANAIKNIDKKEAFPTDQDLISTIIEDAFPKNKSNQQLGIPQSDTFAFASYIFLMGMAHSFA
tara:strand:- start:363 stop:647 length:285 start_codon:yes stop_codon:yes gene_type:complete